MRLVFMGTSSFALPALLKIFEDKNLEIVAVYTKEPSVAGRGQKIRQSPIHNFALQNNLKIYTPNLLKDPKIQTDFVNLKPDIAIVVSYGIILPRAILNIPKFGCFNIHPSDLPFYRGCAPLQRSLMNGENNSAVCIIKMDSGVDSGDIVNRQEFQINYKDDFISISTLSAEIGANLMLKTIYEARNNQLKFTQQNHNIATYASKIEKSESLIDWSQNCSQIFNKVRALRGNLEAYFNYNNEKIKILECQILPNQNNYEFGTIIDKNFSIACLDGAIKPTILQRQGKNPVNIQDFLNGFKFEIGKKLN